jgi:membrane-associated protein
VLDHIIYLLQDYKYLLLFPLAIVEGPILAVIAGLLCTRGLLNPLLVYPIIICGDIVGDSVCYALGRWGKSQRLKRISGKLGFKPQRADRVRAFFDAHPVRTVSLSKVILGIGVTGIFLAGSARVPYRKFLLICLGTSMLQYIVYLGIGLVFGQAYIRINHYLDFAASFFIIAAMALILFVFIQSMLRKL